MSDFRTVYWEMEAIAAAHGWTLAAAYKTQDEPEQYPLVLTKEDPAKALFKPLGVHVQDGIQADDVFGGDNG